MTETDVLSTDATTDSSGAAAPERRRRGGVSGMVLAELRELATSLGVSDTTGMRRNDLISEIKKRQSGSGDQLPLGEGAGVRLYLLVLAVGLVGAGVFWGPLAELAAGAVR